MGGLPVNNNIIIIPALNISTLLLYKYVDFYSSKFRTSGATYPGVPHLL